MTGIYKLRMPDGSIATATVGEDRIVWSHADPAMVMSFEAFAQFGFAPSSHYPDADSALILAAAESYGAEVIEAPAAADEAVPGRVY